MSETMEKEIKKIEENIKDMEERVTGYTYAHHAMFEYQININKASLVILKELTDHPKEKDWI